MPARTVSKLANSSYTSISETAECDNQKLSEWATVVTVRAIGKLASGISAHTLESATNYYAAHGLLAFTSTLEFHVSPKFLYYVMSKLHCMTLYIMSIQYSPIQSLHDSAQQGKADSEQYLYIHDTITMHPVVVFAKTTCNFCNMAKDVLNDIGVCYDLENIDHHDNLGALQDMFESLTGARTVGQ